MAAAEPKSIPIEDAGGAKKSPFHGNQGIASTSKGIEFRTRLRNIAGDVEEPYDRPMTGMTREELEAHLKAQAAQADAALARQNGAIDARLGQFEERINQAVGEMRRDRGELNQKIDSLQSEVRSESKAMRTTLILTAVSTVLAIVIGVAAFNATVLSNMVASFESGKNTMSSINETTKRLEALQDRIEARSAQQAPPAPPK